MKTIRYTSVLLFCSLVLFFCFTANAQPDKPCKASFTTCEVPMGALGVHIQFTNTSSGAFTNSFWSFGDGTTSAITSPLHTYTGAQSFAGVCLAITDPALNCSSSVCDSVKFNNQPSCTNTGCIDSALIGSQGVCPFIYAPVCGCNGVTYANSCEALNAGVRDWTPGACNNQQGCNANFTYKLKLVGPQTAKVHFTSQSVDSSAQVSYNWNFGDGKTSTRPNPIHKYTHFGKYDVCLVVASGGCSSVHCDTVNFPPPALIKTAGPPPPPACSANFKDKLKLIAPQTARVHFTNESITTGTITAYNWNFGDGKKSTRANPTHKYTRFGKYDVCLTIATSTGCTSVKCDTVNFPPPALQQPLAGGSNCGLIAKWKAVKEGGGVVNFSATPNNQGNILYIWNFGDGTTGGGLNVSHTYEQSGNYDVCLVVKVTVDNCADTSCREIKVNVNQECHAAFESCALPAGIAGLAIQFTNSSTGPYTLSQWSFGDGNTSEVTNPVHVYTSGASAYDVCLTVSGTAANCHSKVCDTVYSAHTFVCVPPDTCINPALINHNVACPDVVAPVCGCNGVTYTNSCVAEYYNGVTHWTLGACPVGTSLASGGTQNDLRGDNSGATANNSAEQEAFALQVYPNPAGDVAHIQYTLPVPANVVIEITDMTGRNMAHLFNGIQAAGINMINWNAQNTAEGIYLVTVLAGGKLFTRRLSIVH